MRIVSYLRDGAERYGIVDPDSALSAPEVATVVDVRDAIADAPVTVTEFLARLDEFRDAVAGLPMHGQRLGDLDLAPVIPRPGNIICIGVNYVDHASETGDVVPPFPLIFTKVTSSIAAHGSPIRIPAGCTEPDYEAELGLVIGRDASNVSPADALDYVGAYFTLNDVSARDFQVRTSQWVQGKSFPTFAPTGPYMVTPDEFGDPSGRRISLVIGDEVLQDAETGDMVFDVPTIISYLSSVCDLRAGDVIATGTPSGVGVARSPQRFLRAGDVVEVAVEGLPTLVNPVVDCVVDSVVTRG